MDESEHPPQEIPDPAVIEKVEIPVPGENPTVNKRGLMMIAAVISAAFVLIVAAMTWSYFRIQSLAHDNQDSIHRLDSILKPTPKQYREQLKRGIKLCLAEPECRKLFPQISSNKKTRARAIRKIRARLHREAILAARRAERQAHQERQFAGRPPGNERTANPQRRSGKPPRRPSRSPSGGGGGGGPSPGGGGGSGGNPPPPSRPPVAKTPEVQVGPVTVPSIEIPCPEAPLVKC